MAVLGHKLQEAKLRATKAAGHRYHYLLIVEQGWNPGLICARRVSATKQYSQFYSFAKRPL